MSEKNLTVKKKPSGYENRKRRTEKEQWFDQNKKLMSIDKFVIPKKQDDHTDPEELSAAFASSSTAVTTIPAEGADLAEPMEVLEDNVAPSVQNQGLELLDNSEDVVHVQEINDDKCEDMTQETLILSDCGTWPIRRNIKTVDHLIKIGPKQIVIDKYPTDEKGRHFSSSYYSRKLSNGEAFCRRWLVYSVSKDSVFCFCCRLFDNNSNSKLVCDGFNKWKHLSETVGIHENSTSHRKCYQQWVETEMRMKLGQTIDKEEQKMIEKESYY